MQVKKQLDGSGMSFCCNEPETFKMLFPEMIFVVTDSTSKEDVIEAFNDNKMIDFHDIPEAQAKELIEHIIENIKSTQRDKKLICFDEQWQKSKKTVSPNIETLQDVVLVNKEPKPYQSLNNAARF